MNTTARTLTTLLLSATALTAQAQSMKPGLWSISTQMSGSPEMEQAMAAMQKQLAAMPAEQRKKMEEMMGKQGVSMGSTPGSASVKVCLTQAMIERNVLSSHEGNCQHTNSPRMGSSMKYSFTCTQPPSSGEGEVNFISPESYSMRVTVNSTVKGKPNTMTMNSKGQFLSADCGNVKPLAMPK